MGAWPHLLLLLLLVPARAWVGAAAAARARCILGACLTAWVGGAAGVQAAREERWRGARVDGQVTTLAFSRMPAFPSRCPAPRTAVPGKQQGGATAASDLVPTLHLPITDHMATEGAPCLGTLAHPQSDA